MSDVKRRDRKNRILNTGESQRANGLYSYKYTDKFGNRKEVTSWRLTAADPVPAGKRPKPPLREMEKEINKLQNLRIGNDGVTVLELVDRYIETKINVTHNTRAGYQTVHNLLEKHEFGSRQIDKIKYSDAILFLQRLQSEGRSYSSVGSIRGVIRPAFRMAVRDEMIINNPFDQFQLAEVLINDTVKREALSKQEEKKFLDFVKEDKHFSRYYDGIYLLFKTGMRISEFCGLTVADIDFEEKVINIDKQLQKERGGVYIIADTKTEAGARRLPYSGLDPELDACLHRIVENRKKPKVEPMVDGKAGFLFLDKNGNPMVAMHWEKYFQHIIQKYNKTYRVQMPKVTPHVCRHTFATNQAKRGIAPKTLQYLMGHSDINVTLNVYTHMDFDGAKENLESVQDELSRRRKKTKSRKTVAI